jgi:flagellum-specific peptidoglycan hydrolase FlgJ
MNTPFIFIIIVFLGMSLTSTVHAGSTIYKHVDADGSITFTNRPIKGAQAIQSRPDSPRSQTIAAMRPAHFPKASVQAQQKRDVKRRQILENELAEEMKFFSETRRFLSRLSDGQEAQQQKDRMRRLHNKLQRHESNIASLKKELERF